MEYILFMISALTGVLSSSLIKIYKEKNIPAHLSDGMFLIINIAASLLVFALISNFNLKVNTVTLMFSLIYAVVCYFSVILDLTALKVCSLVNVSLFKNSGSLLVSFLWGALLLKETVTFKEITGVMLVMLSVILPYLSAAGNIKKEEAFYLPALFLISGASPIIMKLYYSVPSVKPESVFCFYTNVFLFPFMAIMQWKCLRKENIFRAIAKTYRKEVAIAALAIVATNVSTLLGMVAVGKTALVFSSVFTKPLTLISFFLVDVFVFKEKTTKAKAVSILLCLASIFFIV